MRGAVTLYADLSGRASCDACAWEGPVRTKATDAEEDLRLHWRDSEARERGEG